MAITVLGVEHKNKESVQAVRRMIERIDAPRDSTVFLLEYHPAIHEKHHKKYHKKLLSGSTTKGVGDLYLISHLLDSYGIPYVYIDREAIRAKEEFIASVGWREFLRFLWNPRDLENLESVSPLFRRYMLEKREQAMIEEIISVLQSREHDALVVIVGKDHEGSIIDGLKRKVPDDVRVVPA